MLRRAAPLALAVALASCKNPQPCPTPLEECDGQCVDVQSDRRHCGGCGVACRAGEACTAARCNPDVRAPCPDRVGGAFVTFGHCGGAVKVWVQQVDFVDEAATYVGSTAGRTPVLSVLQGSDCDGQWSWHADDATPAFQGTVSSSAACDVCPVVIQANVPAYVLSSGRWCPSAVRVLAVDRRAAP